MSEPVTNVAEYTVSEISFALKREIEERFGFVRVRGEISGYRGPHSSGHAYFSLKDEGARIEAVIWRGTMGKIRFRPEEGMEVIATGRLTTFPGSSKYQIVIEQMEPAGVGALMALLEERRRKLAAEGLFEAARKRPLPFLPKVIGVVTSPTGAVIRDILHRLADRFPVHVLVWPVRVQGETSAAEVAAAIRGFDALPEGGDIPRPDVLIVARGGGSLEDLWGFNEEVVVRAAADCSIPLISAVGHETDWTLIDHVADVRAPTPTGAAEMAVPVRRELLDRTADLARRLDGAAHRGIDLRRTRLLAAARALPKPADVLALPRQRLDAVGLALVAALRTNTTVHGRRFERVAARLGLGGLERANALHRERLGALAARAARAVAEALRRDHARLDRAVAIFDAVNHKATLRRGFALVRDGEGRPVFSAAAVLAGARLDVEFADGRIAVTAEGEPAEPSPAAASGARKPKAKRGGPDQGSLF
ncbi:exodeoxyribonuclease VII large subunit [Oharaeibacter diazotrophicus]|uniref:Exodeoxyribonuclease 7 large subunit n=2 Tax=Oharaeibacter diazotrophicus TaxID=1920512 RepID=A0A4R6RBP5_9HYPH|nr:exodeoxyribonuclease VII large subunit [Oharaeibacter diazotrophicus]TDP83502.1 exodeoxyribonuclease VII large subunit [Oharaeibacter diazotrophicus]BBE72335.1 exodeoxyribonuclease 7 large subunit [Pleomorphomonas sp. SM30]GLS79105.1 exodeoxyribonuclease 7 large subunit [Oharaeibacter diazotrophicus]